MSGPAALPEPRPRILYVEDEVPIAQVAVEVLGEFYRVDHAETGEAGLDLALKHPYDAMVIDRRLPGMSGTELIGALRTAHIRTPIILLTALGTVHDRVEGLDAGANDYVVKPFDFEELLARLRAQLRDFRAHGERVSVGEWLYIPQSQTLFDPSGLRTTLTEQENRLLGLLASSPNHVYSREEILSAAFTGGESRSAVDTYVHYLRAKSTPSLIETVRGRGYRLGDGA